MYEFMYKMGSFKENIQEELDFFGVDYKESNKRHEKKFILD